MIQCKYTYRYLLRFTTFTYKMRSGGKWDVGRKKIVTKTKYPTPFYFNGDFIIILMICNIIPHLFNNQLLDCTSTAVTLLMVAF
jgi:hypothetical protein